MPTTTPPHFETCGCEVDFTPGTMSRRQPPLSYAHSHCSPKSLRTTDLASPPNAIPGRCERHQTEWLKAHEAGLLAYMDLRVHDAKSKLAAAQTHEGIFYSKREMRFKKRQLKAEETIRGMAALGLWSRYPARWGLCAVTTGGTGGGETGLVRLEEVVGMLDESERELDEGWEDEDENEDEDGDEEVEKASLKDRKKDDGMGGGVVVETGGQGHGQSARLRTSLGSESGSSEAADRKWYWWW